MVTPGESEVRFQQLAENIDEVFWLTDVRKQQMLYVNPAYEMIWGRSRSDLYEDAAAWLEAVHPDDRARVEAAVPGQVRGEYDEQYRIIRPDGEIRWVRDRAVPVRDESGEVVRVAGIAVDMTAIVEVEQALRESEARLRQIAEHLDVGVWIYKADFSEALYVSPQVGRLWGLPVEKIYEDPLFFLKRVHPEDLPVVKAAMRQNSDDDEAEIYLRRVLPDGSHRWLCITAFAIRDDGGEMYRAAGITADVTERRAFESMLQDREAHYRRLVETSPYAIYALDGEGRFTELNPAAEDALGRPAAELLGRPYLGVVHPDDVALAEQAFQQLQAGETRRLDVQLRVKNPRLGTRWLSIAIASVYDEVTGAAGVHGIGRDITEDRSRKQHLRRVERFASMGTLMGGVAHELNNPLQAIAGFADLLLEGESDPAREREALQTIAREARRASRIVADLRLLARKAHEGTSRYEPVSVNDVVRHVIRARRYAHVTSNIEVDVELAAEPPLVNGDPDRLEQVLLNLVVNAEQALATVDAPRRISIRTRPTARGVAMVVNDNGPGIDMESLPHLFDPFWTTKPPGMGTGLGLAMVHSIVQEHGGAVHVESEVGRGARFQVDLPGLRQRPQQQPREATVPPVGAVSTAPPPARSIRILTVDDESAIRGLITRIAERRGHEVEQAVEGEEALRAVASAEAEGRPFDLIISDLRMPGVDGRRFIEALADRAVPYAERVVLMTGDPDSDEVTRIREAVPVRVMAKPLGVADLVALMQVAEDRGGAVASSVADQNGARRMEPDDAGGDAARREPDDAGERRPDG